MYLFKYNLPINPAYRQGMTRVGCLICPFSSEWNDMVSNVHYKEKLKPFIDRIEQSTKDSGVQDVRDYIKLGNWKRRAGGRDIHFPSFMQIQEKKPDICFIITNLHMVGECWSVSYKLFIRWQILRRITI